MSAPRSRKVGWAVGALLAALVAGGLLARGRPSVPPPDGARGVTGEADAGSTPSPGALAPVTPGAPPVDVEALRTVPCALDPLVEEYRGARASPAYRRYLHEQVHTLGGVLPEEALWAKLREERDPEVLALLADTWVARYPQRQDPRVLERLVARVGTEPEPAARAALIRALQRTGEPSVELLGRKVLRGHDPYPAWVKDAAPEVRGAVVDNVRAEAARNFGRFQGVAERAVALAVVATDPRTRADLLLATSIEATRAPAVATVRGLLADTEPPEVRAAAARALGTAPASEVASSLQALAARYPLEGDPGVREALLESISRLGLARAVPVLQGLRGEDPIRRAEVDGWLSLLSPAPGTAALLLRDKQAREARGGK